MALRAAVVAPTIAAAATQTISMRLVAGNKPGLRAAASAEVSSFGSAITRGAMGRGWTLGSLVVLRVWGSVVLIMADELTVELVSRPETPAASAATSATRRMAMAIMALKFLGFITNTKLNVSGMHGMHEPGVESLWYLMPPCTGILL